jgi:hypothetical protein
MLNRITRYLVPAAALMTLAVAANDAHSGINAPGLVLKAVFASDAGCLSVNTGYADIKNNCAHAVEVEGTLPVLSEGWHNTSVSLFANNTWCQTISTNGVGNGANLGTVTWTTAGPRTWQTLNLGDRFVWSWAALSYHCGLEPGGVIGEYLSN